MSSQQNTSASMRLLVAVDGSDPSHHALQGLAHLRRATDVVLIHVLDIPIPAYPMMVPEISDELFLTAKRAMETEGARLLRHMQAGLPLDSGPCSTRLEVGKPAEVIVSLARETHSDLVVLGTRGLGPIKEILLGSVAHRVLVDAPCSVLVVNQPLRSLRQVLLPVETSEDLDAAIRFLKMGPFREKPAIDLLTVLPFSPPPWPAGAVISQQMERDLVEGGRLFLEAAGNAIGELGYRVTSRVLIGSPSETIRREAERGRADLLMLGSRQRHGVSRLLLGSVSHSLLHRPPCPVLMIHE